MEIRENDLTFSHQAILCLQRLLYFDEHIRCFPDILGRSKDLSASGNILAVVEPGLDPGIFFNKDLMAFTYVSAAGVSPTRYSRFLTFNTRSSFQISSRYKIMDNETVIKSYTIF